MTRTAAWLAVAFVAIAVVAPWVAPYDPGLRHEGHEYAPPMGVHLDGRGLYAVPIVLEDPLTQEYRAVPGGRTPLPWLARDTDAPVFLLGADGLGHDVLSRLLHGARWSIGLGVVATVATLCLGALLGGWAGVAGGRVEAAVLQLGDILLVAPITYVVVLLRAWLPDRLDVSTAFAAMTAVFACATWPWVARGVRAIVAAERERDYVAAARAAGAGAGHVLRHHLLPACLGFLLGQVALLVPTFVLAEAALSFVGLGFPSEVTSWGAMIRDGSDVVSLLERPWLLAPAAAVFGLVLAANLVSRRVGGPATPSRPLA